MLARTDPSPARNSFADRRLYAVKVFVVVTGVLVIAGVVLFVALRRNPLPAATIASPTPSPAASPASPKEMELLVNEFLFDDRFVVEVLTPGAEPKIRYGRDPITHRMFVTLSWSPPERADAEPRIRTSRREWQLAAFTRTVLLPDGVTIPDDAVQKNGVLTLSFPLKRASIDDIVPRKEN